MIKIEKINDVFLAGVIDVKGSFYISKDKNQAYQSTLSFTSKSDELLEWAKQNFGGGINSFEYISKTQFGIRTMICAKRITFCGDNLLKICVSILPYMIAQKQLCQLMITFRETFKIYKNNVAPSEYIISIREMCLQEYKQLSKAK